MYTPSAPERSTPTVWATLPARPVESTAPERGLMAPGMASSSPSSSMDRTNISTSSMVRSIRVKASIVLPSRSTMSPLASMLNLPVDTGSPSTMSQPS